MIFVSTACIASNDVVDATLQLVNAGICNIELSGGCLYREGILEDLVVLKNKYNINFVCHNYFPPPKIDFVINLASLDDEMYAKSLSQLTSSLVFSRALMADRFSFHAGFYFDLKVAEVGRKVESRPHFNQLQSLEKFSTGYTRLANIAEQYSIKLYIENNVISYLNFQNNANANPFMLVDYGSYVELKQLIDFNLLCDIGHLKVSCTTLKESFVDNFEKMYLVSDYFHFSENDGKTDQNLPISEKTGIFNVLKNFDFSHKHITLEYQCDVDEIKRSYNFLLKELKC